MKNISGLILILIFLSACSEPVRREFHDGSLDLDSLPADIQVHVNPRKETSSVSPKGELNTAKLFEHFYILQTLGERTSRSFWARDSQTHLLKFYDQPQTHSSVLFSESPYAKALTAISQKEYFSATQDLDKVFGLEQEKLHNVLIAAGSKVAASDKAISLSKAMQAIVEFMNHFESQLLKSDVDDAFKAAILAGVYEEFWLKLPASRSIINQLESSVDFEAAVATLKGLVSTMDIELSEDERGQLHDASEIGPMLNQDRLKPKHAFVILVRLWDLMNEEERLEEFGTLAPDLYDYLNSKSRKAIECLKIRKCKGLMDKFAEKFVIVPEIKKYGTQKLQAEIEASAVNGLKELTAEMATELIQDLPSYLGEAIDKKMDKEKASLKEIRARFPIYVRDETQKWFQSKFEREKLPALEQRLIVLKDAEGFKLDSTNKEVETSADAMGTAFLASAQLFRKTRTPKADSNSLQLLGLVRVGQLLAHSGFSLHNGRAFESLNRAFVTGKPFNIEDGFDFPTLFAMKSPVKVRSGFDIVLRSAPKDWNVISQSRLLMGFSHSIDSFKDWEDRSMKTLHSVLGEIQAKDLLPGIPSEELAQSAFPNDAFLAVSFGNAAAILNNLSAKGTPFFTLCQDDSLVWNDSKLTCKKRRIMGGIVNVVNGKRATRVELESQAKFLEAVIAFMKRSEEMIDNTSSSYLKEVDKECIGTKGKKCTSAVYQYREAQPELRLLALALTNFIVKKFQDKDGNFGYTYALNKKGPGQPLSGKAEFSEHLQAIRAIVASAEYFDMPVYKTEAVRAYYGLNKNFYNSNTQFYRTGNANVNTMDLAKTLETLERLSPWVKNTDSRNQLESLLEAWRNSLRPKSI